MRKDKKYSLTTIFALPLCGHMRSFYEPYLVNAYLRDKDVEGYLDHVFILLKYKGDKRFIDIEESLSKDDAIFYDLENGSYVMYIRKIKDCFLEDFEKFKNGRYSEFSKAAKRAIKS